MYQKLQCDHNNILRAEKRKQRKLVSDIERNSAENKILQHCERLQDFHQATHVALYLSNDGEISTKQLIDYCWNNNKYCYLPVTTDSGQLNFIAYTAQTIMQPNQYGILEPQNKLNNYPVEQLDLVFLPLTVFDRDCQRMGMGKGYYDKTFAFLHAYKKNKLNRHHSPKLFGLAYEFQKVDKIVANDWDVPLDGVVTETKIYYP